MVPAVAMAMAMAMARPLDTKAGMVPAVVRRQSSLLMGSFRDRRRRLKLKRRAILWNKTERYRDS